MKKITVKAFSSLLLIIALVFVFPSVMQINNIATPLDASALLSADDPELTRELVQQEMYERYKTIFDFVSSSSIITENQAIPFESGNQASDSEINALAAELTISCSTDYEKASAIYNWIVENIYYDYDYYNGAVTSTYRSAVDVFKYKYTVCEGFSNLYTAMCRSVGVPCRKVIGYGASNTVSDDEYFAGYFENLSNHAWNEVYINDEWLVVDATWDCGNRYENGEFVKKNRAIKWFDMAFDEFSKRHMGMSYDDTFKSDKFTFTVENNKITASNYVGTARKVIVPKGVDVITDLSKTKSDFTAVVLPVTLKEISTAAFKNCTELVSVTVPEGVEGIGSEAFAGCSALVTVKLPATLKSLGKRCFNNCSALMNIAIPEGVDSISSLAFGNCTALEEIVIPSTVTRIESSAFKGCSSIKTITLPESVTHLGSSAFQGCTGLESAVINCNVSSVNSSVFSRCTSLTTVYISDSVTEISDNAFRECTSLKTVTGAENVTVLRYQAFLGCTLLENCDFFNKLTRLEYHVFKECQSITEVTIPFTYENIDEYDFYNCSSLERVVIKGNVTSIDEAAFYNCTSLKEVIIPDTVTTIGEFAFAKCTSLESIDLPDSLTAISNSMFSGCVMLKSIGGDIPSTVTSIGEYAFYDCDLQGEFTIPDSVSVVPTAAFYQCAGITRLNIPVSVKTISEFAFTRLNKLTDVYYAGTSAQWEEIIIGDNNSAFLAAELHCIDDHQHSYISAVTTNATCTSFGVLTYTCSCGDTYSEDIPMLAHTEVVISAVDATCVNTGLTSGVKCSVCGEVIATQTVTPALGHKESGWITDTSATCSKVGTKHTECTTCGETIKTEVISKLSHTEATIPAVSATCVNTGLTSGVKCSVCGEVIAAQTVTPALGHKESGWITDTPATCSNVGAKHTECTACGETIKTAVISKLSHTEATIPAVSATCVNTGLTSGVKCSVCGEIIVAQTVTPALGHNESECITDIAATCTKEGVQHTECTVCGAVVRNSKISKLSHKDSNNDNICDICSATVNASADCTHMCHKDGFSGFIWSIIRFFSKFFGTNKVCECGAVHY